MMVPMGEGGVGVGVRTQGGSWKSTPAYRGQNRGNVAYILYERSLI